ncbi:MAG: tRNA pseudouridine(13) synthase TruD [Gemmataceae bacterium]
MKLKQQPEDFRVEELTDAQPEGRGEFAFYRLDKTGWTTPDAINAIRRRWNIDWPRVSYGGLKDRHAITSQHLTIFRGPERDITVDKVKLAYLGRLAEPFTAADIRANRFTLVLRSLSAQDLDRAEHAIREVQRAGLPNYFDDQRFGSVGDANEFVAKEMVFGRFDRALWLALAAPYEHDRSEAKREKQLLREKWGDWSALKAALPKGHARSIIDYLATHPTDQKGAVARLRPELQGLYLSAYQSELWNRMLAAWLDRKFGSDNLCGVAMKRGRVPAPVRVPDDLHGEWEQLELPLPSARLKPDDDAPWAKLVDDVLAAEGLTLPEMRIKGMQKPFFSRGERAGCVRPENLGSLGENDEKHRTRKKLTLRFDLPRGSYATMLVKRITAVSPADRGR